MPDIQLLKPVHSANVAARVYGNDAVIISPDEGVVRMLNPTATRIWHLIDGTRSTDEIAVGLTHEFDIDLSHARQSVERLLGEFSEKQLITWVSH